MTPHETKQSKERIDQLLVDRNLTINLKKARSLVMAGQVTVEGTRVDKAGTMVGRAADIRIATPSAYVGRGGIKLAHALQEFSLDINGIVALDVGASTGGFTDCLLQKGARRVHALDVGYGQLNQRLRDNPKVVTLERVNARNSFKIEESVDLATVDVSFISLTKILPRVVEHIYSGGHIIALAKPQFEAARSEVGKGGVVWDPQVHAKVLARLISWVVSNDLRLRGLTPSPILGDAGNREFFLLLEVTA